MATPVGRDPIRSDKSAEIGSDGGYLDQVVQIAYPPDRAEIETEPTCAEGWTRVAGRRPASVAIPSTARRTEGSPMAIT